MLPSPPRPQTLQTLFSAPRLGEPGARAPLFTPETDKLRLDSPFPFLGSGKGLWVLVPTTGCVWRGGACCMCLRGKDRQRWGETGCRKEAQGEVVCAYVF